MKKLSAFTHFIIWFSLLSTAIYAFGLAGSAIKTVGDIVQCTAAFIALACAIVNAYLQRKGKLRFVWGLLALGVAFIFLGYATYALDELVYGPKSTLLLVSQILALPTYTTLLVAVIAAIKNYRNAGAGPIKIGHLALVSIFFALILYLAIVKPILGSPGSLTSHLLAITAPLADFSLLMLTLILAQVLGSIHHDAESKAWQTIVGGLVLFSLTDSLYERLTAEGAYHTGMLIDLGWIVSLSILSFGLSELIYATRKERLIDSIRQNISSSVIV